MKIAILTLPLHSNYGGILQCYALQTFLERMGHEVCVIIQNNYHFSYKHVLKGIVRRIVCKLLGRHKFVEVNLRSYLECWKISRFVRKYIHYSPSLLLQMKEYSYDAIVVGSDQVWRPCYANEIEKYYLSFLPEKSETRRIAYAASFGVDREEYLPRQVDACGKLYSLFDAVSVRERSGVDLINAYGWQGKYPPVHVLDPTMLLTGEQYVKYLKIRVKPRHTLFAYVLDETSLAQKIVSQLADEKQLCVELISSIDFAERYVLKKSPAQWLEHIAATEFVVTDSFHGCVFSILFGKPFVTTGNVNRGNARLDSLLELLGLTNRRVVSYEDFNQRRGSLSQPIEYDRVEEILQKERAKSLNFLEYALS